MHLEELQATDARCAKNETLLWKNHTEQFAQWVKKKVVLFTLLDYHFSKCTACYLVTLFT